MVCWHHALPYCLTSRWKAAAVLIASSTPSIVLPSLKTEGFDNRQFCNYRPISNLSFSMASLGWVTPGAATEGVTPLFFPEKPGDLFLLIAVTITVAFYTFTRVSPLQGVTPHLFYLSDLVSPLFFVNLPKKNVFPSRCHPLEDVTRGGPPPSDATAHSCRNFLNRLFFFEETAQQHVDRIDCIPMYQAGYRRGHSTETALLKVMNDCHTGSRSSKVSLLCLLDLSAAFDTVDRQLLLTRV